MLELQWRLQEICLSTYKLDRSEYKEADILTKSKRETFEKYVVNLTGGNPNSCLIKIGKQKIRCLIDSGSSTSLISYKFYNSLQNKPKLHSSSAYIESYSGNSLDVKGKVTLKFSMKGLHLEHTFMVVQGANRNMLLGDDWLTSNAVRLYFDLGCLRVKGVYIPLVADIHVNSICRLAKSITLAPNCSYVTYAKVKRNQNYSEYMVNSLDEHCIAGQPGIELSDTVVRVKNDSRKILLGVTNYTNRYIKLDNGTVLGMIKPIGDDIQIETVNHIRSNQNKTCEKEMADLPSQDGIKSQIHTDESHRSIVENLVLNNLDVFAFKDSDVLECDLVQMKIELTDETPFKIRPYRLSPDDQKTVDKAVREWESSGIISRSRSPFNSSAVVVSKKDGSRRVCIDFRKLNSRTKPYVFPLAQIDDVLSKLGGANYISIFDLKSGFFAVGIEPSSRDYTAFSCSRGSFRFNRAPFGLRNSTSFFCEMMSLALDGLEDFCSFYMDDIIVWSKTLQEHIDHINKLFTAIRKHKLKLSLKKCQFLKAESNHLDFIVSPKGVKADPQKVDAIKNLAPPTNVKECRGFIAMCSYYRRFVPNFAKISEPIVALTKKHARFKWDEQCQAAFDYMKESLTVIPLLSHVNPNEKFILYTDASNTCIGAVLVQEHKDGDEIYEKPCYFLSHKLSKCQIKWATVEKECYAIYYALERLHHWVSCSQIICKTDHAPLKYLLTSRFKNRKIASWQMTIAEYNIDIQYLQGKKNCIADLMSRRPNIHVDSRDNTVRQDDMQVDMQVDEVTEVHFDPSKHVQPQFPLYDLDEKPKLVELDTYAEQQTDANIVNLIQNLDMGNFRKT